MMVFQMYVCVCHHQHPVLQFTSMPTLNQLIQICSLLPADETGSRSRRARVSFSAILVLPHPDES